MSQRTSAVLWLVIGLCCGFLTLVACAGGGYGIWHTHSKVKLLEERSEEIVKEQTDPKKLFKAGRREELKKDLDESDKEKAEFERYRFFAIAGAAISLLPGLMTLVFLGVAAAKFMKKSRPKSDVAEVDEEDEEPPKKKPTPKAKPKDDDD